MIAGSHTHAYYIPTDDGGAGRITHVSVTAAEGFTPDEVAALNGLRELKLDEVIWRLQLVGLGQPSDFRSRVFGPARVWESATPFVVTRHVKRRGRKKDPPECVGIDGRREFARLVLKEELARWDRLQKAPVQLAGVNDIDHLQTGVGRSERVLAFRRARSKKAGDDSFRRAAAAFRLEFDKPVLGPICVGHLSHFGLRLFLAAEEGAG